MLVHVIALGLFAAAVFGTPAFAGQVKTVFVIALENHNFTQPLGADAPDQILGNPAAPYVNSLLTPGNPNAANAAYATDYRNAAVGVHPSEPNYVWSEAGSNLGNHTDADPTVANRNIYHSQSLSSLMQQKGVSWKSYLEDAQIDTTANKILPKAEWVAPLTSQAGTSSGYVNAYNGSHQYSYAPKHVPQVFFAATNGPELISHFVPLQQLSADLANNTTAQYNWIAPDQYNDMHSPLANGFSYKGANYTGDQAAVAEGDHFLSILVPEIEQSRAFKDNGAIILWWDETEGGDTSHYTIPEIVISPDAVGNAFASNVPLTHSSDLLTMEEIFDIGRCIGDSCSANSLASLFKLGAIPGSPHGWPKTRQLDGTFSQH